jgi:acyl transferase domain-containing protein
MNDTCITTSGHPNTLERFIHTLPAHGVTIRETKINALYHFPSLLHTVRGEVLGDIASRNIRFPTIADLFAPVRSTFTGELISTASTSANLAELVVDMILIQPVNWDLVVSKAKDLLPWDSQVQLVNIGLGSSLAKGLEKAFRDRGVRGFSSVKFNEETIPPKVKQEPIAIIGMAVNMPGSPNVGELWKLLEAGGNTIQKVGFHGRLFLPLSNFPSDSRSPKIGSTFQIAPT